MNTTYAKGTLPEGYLEAEKIDLVKNKKQMLLVNGLALLLAAVMAVIGVALQPPRGFHSLIFSIDDAPMAIIIKCAVLLVGLVVYIIGHEAVHGIFMWHYSHQKPRFGLSFTYAYAGSDIYFAKKPYLVIALAPLVVWAVVLAVVILLVPADWFWIVWFIQINNVSGAAGDLFVFFHMLRKPEAVLVQDTGTAMTVFLPQQ